jgi:hypothetical protein
MALGITPRRVAGLAIAGVSAVAASSAHAQETIWRVYGSNENQFFGMSLDLVGDIDGDGIGDFLAGTSGDPSNPKAKGFVKRMSGVDGSEFSKVTGLRTGDRFGTSVAGIGDVDLDGVADYAVGAPGVDVQGLASGAVYAISGASGSVLYEIDGNAGDQLGATVAALGDVDGDGFCDFAVGSWSTYALMVSGATGKVLATLSCSKPSVSIKMVAGGGDLDGDGVPDVALGDVNSSLGSWYGGAVSLFSGATGQPLYEIASAAGAAYFGVVEFTEDVDGDGTPDLFIGAPFDSTYAVSGGSCWVYSGRTGALITGFVPGSATACGGWAMGESVRSAGDTNGDGAVDWLIGVIGYAGSPSGDRGTVFLMSGRDGGLLYHFEEPAGSGTGLGMVIAKPRDFDGDGVVDFPFGAPGVGHATLGGCGDVSIRKGHAFWVDATPRIATANQPVTLTIGQGFAGNPYALVLRGLNGTPCYTPLVFGLLDATGRGVLAGNVPPGLGANQIDFQALTLDGYGKLLASGVETLTTQ